MAFKATQWLAILGIGNLLLCTGIARAENGPIVDVPALYEACENERKSCDNQTTDEGHGTCFNTYRQCIAAAKSAGASQNADALYKSYGYVPPGQSTNQPAVAPGNEQTSQ